MPPATGQGTLWMNGVLCSSHNNHAESGTILCTFTDQKGVLQDHTAFSKVKICIIRLIPFGDILKPALSGWCPSPFHSKDDRMHQLSVSHTSFSLCTEELCSSSGLQGLGARAGFSCLAQPPPKASNELLSKLPPGTEASVRLFPFQPPSPPPSFTKDRLLPPGQNQLAKEAFSKQGLSFPLHLWCWRVLNSESSRWWLEHHSKKEQSHKVLGLLVCF